MYFHSEPFSVLNHCQLARRVLLEIAVFLSERLSPVVFFRFEDPRRLLSLLFGACFIDKCNKFKHEWQLGWRLLLKIARWQASRVFASHCLLKRLLSSRFGLMGTGTAFGLTDGGADDSSCIESRDKFSRGCRGIIAWLFGSPEEEHSTSESFPLIELLVLSRSSQSLFLYFSWLKTNCWWKLYEKKNGFFWILLVSTLFTVCSIFSSNFHELKP